MNDKVWLVTGASKGLGLSLVNKLLNEGFKVVATSRNLENLISETRNQTENFLPLKMNVTDENSAQQSVQQIINKFGTIDVVVNNAGYGQTGAIEELTNTEIEESFRVNVYGVMNVIKCVMPYFRKNKSGHFFNISSVGGFTGNYAGWGAYCSVKFAVAGLTEALFAETKALGIKSTVVYPGAFRTHFLSNTSLKTPSNLIDQYADARASQAFYQSELNGNQQGNPEKFAEAIIKISQEANPPLHLFLGKDAYNASYKKMELVKTDLEKWKNLALSTSFEE